ncbi:hypothetical protein BN7_5545 [Wickerhamomyces ciferrii]|uniref:Uncharacterized protein n=1 Tax=Wickerhamomyces ciferrii (strain ATCC 14091 / BCRC 22168 / CBS 111 / JCM 3599 / NBRC 0793 / NRRL Y-1031 F-60-10) TaxID=1206466 RepID=K0KXZ4_WICCF|nr:uncharacterized protein BN7_5545 [Wickerhamomyces ciferrii]CCH45958.1 hypothetical protein BN7_5545 [Wickerhamomyces ciferrii]
MNYHHDSFQASPKSSITYDESFQILKSRNMRKPTIQNEDIVQQLENFRFPKAYSITPKLITTPCKEKEEEEVEDIIPISPTHISTEGFRRISSGSMMSNSNQIPTGQRLRRYSHRRSEAVSGASSDDSLFSNLCSTSKTLTRDTSIHSNNSVSITPTKLEFEDISISRKSSFRGNLKTSTVGTKQPIIDLDVASKPLQPRLGSPLPIQAFPQYHGEVVEFNFQDENFISEEEEEEEEVETKEDSQNQDQDQNQVQDEDESKEDDHLSLFEFLKESISESSQNGTENYNPFQHIHLTRSWWASS